MMDTIQTNRELYVALAELMEREKHTTRTLEEYLLTLWKLSYSYHEQPSLSLAEFFLLLIKAFTAPVPPFDETWRASYEEDTDDMAGFEG